MKNIVLAASIIDLEIKRVNRGSALYIWYYKLAQFQFQIFIIERIGVPNMVQTASAI